MATNNSANVSTGKPKVGGAIFTAPLATALPTDAVTALASAYENVGYAANSGVINSIATESNSVNAWGGDEVINEKTSRKESFKFTAVETNPVTMKLVFGDENVTIEDNGFAVLHNGLDLPSQRFVFEILLKGRRIKRIVVPQGKVTTVGDIIYVDGDPIGYEITISALPDELGNTAYEYIAEVA